MTDFDKDMILNLHDDLFLDYIIWPQVRFIRFDDW